MVKVNFRKFSRSKVEEIQEMENNDITENNQQSEEITEYEPVPVEKNVKQKKVYMDEIQAISNELEELNNLNYNKIKPSPPIEVKTEVKQEEKKDEIPQSAYNLLNNVIKKRNMRQPQTASIPESDGILTKILNRRKSKEHTEEDDEPTPILGKDRRVLISKIQQYKNLFPDILSKFKLKKNPSVEDLTEALDEMEVMVNCGSVQNFLNDSILQCIKIVEGVSTYTRYDVSGMADLLKQNKQFHELCKMLYIKYKVFNNIPPEYQMIMLVATTAYICVEKNKRKASLEAYLNTVVPSPANETNNNEG